MSTFLLGICLLATLIAKYHAVLEFTHGHNTVAEWVGAIAMDVVFYPAVMALFAAGEPIRPWIRYITIFLSMLMLGVAMINAGYLFISSDQVDARILEVGFNRFEEVAGITHLQATRSVGRFSVGMLLLVPTAHVAMRRAFLRMMPDERLRDRQRVHVALEALAMGVAVGVLTSAAGVPRSLGVSLLADNAIVRTYMTLVATAIEEAPATNAEAGMHFGVGLADSTDVQAIAEHSDLPSVLFVVLESTRFDYVELSVPGHRSRVSTPNLLALSRRGVTFTNAQAVVPHTSKSLYAILCARLPSMENPIVEGATGVAHGCLPSVFREAGFATGFFQSALGSFEFRPRLVSNLGYEHFDAYETLETRTPLGYLSADDRGLPPAFERWIGRVPAGRRFFATILTSATHHPYEMPPDRALPEGASPGDRYARAVAIEDEVLGELLAVLRRAGRENSTTLVVMADHGEGLPGDPVQQHDNDFFATSIQVPLVMVGPSFAPARVDRLFSLLDVAPTLLGSFGLHSRLPDDPFYFGLDALRGAPRTRATFSCWHDATCEGMFDNGTKLVWLPSDSRFIALAHDSPGNFVGRPARPNEIALLRENHRRQASTRISSRQLLLPPIQLQNGFSCGAGFQACSHPSRPAGGFHELHSSPTGR